jgi:hypothetical protein
MIPAAPAGRASADGDSEDVQVFAFYDYPAEHWIHLRTTDENVNGVVSKSRSLALSWLPAVAA